MKFSFVGDLLSAVPLLRAVSQSAEHHVSVCAVAGSLLQACAEQSRAPRIADSAEDAIVVSDVEVVVIAVMDHEELLRLTRMAAQAEKHVVVVPPPDSSAALSFELHLIFDEASVGIVPLLPRFCLSDLPQDRHQIAVASASTQQLTLESSADRVNGQTREHLIFGLDLLAGSGIAYSQVTAIQSRAPDGTFLSGIVTLNSQPAGNPVPPASLISRPGDASGEQLFDFVITSTDGFRKRLPRCEGQQLAARVTAVCRDREACRRWLEAFSETLELTDAAEKSLRRRRTVDVHFDSGSERSVFKSQMTAIGCGVLLYVLFGMVAYLVTAQLFSLPDWALYAARLLWAAPLILFLLAQTLLPLARQRSSKQRE